MLVLMMPFYDHAMPPEHVAASRLFTTPSCRRYDVFDLPLLIFRRLRAMMLRVARLMFTPCAPSRDMRHAMFAIPPCR